MYMTVFKIDPIKMAVEHGKKRQRSDDDLALNPPELSAKRPHQGISSPLTEHVGFVEKADSLFTKDDKSERGVRLILHHMAHKEPLLGVGGLSDLRVRGACQHNYKRNFTRAGRLGSLKTF